MVHVDVKCGCKMRVRNVGVKCEMWRETCAYISHMWNVDAICEMWMRFVYMPPVLLLRRQHLLLNDNHCGTEKQALGLSLEPKTAELQAQRSKQRECVYVRTDNCDARGLKPKQM